MSQTVELKYKPPKKKWTVGRVIWEVILFLMICCAVVPVFWGVFLSVKTNPDIMLEPFKIPEVPRWDNYTRAFQSIPYGTMLKNTFFVLLGALPLSVILCIMAAFAIGRMRIGRGRMQNALYKYFIAGIIMPGYVMLFPIYMMSVKMNVYNSLWSLILPGMGCGTCMGVMLLCANFRAIPIELDEAAIIDGCGLPRLLIQVLVPVISPSIATLTILNFLSIWNNFVTARVLINKPAQHVISQAVMYFKGEFSTDYALTMAGTMLLIIPQLIVFMSLQRYVVEGVTAGAVKA